MESRSVLIRGMPISLHDDLKILAVLYRKTLQQLILDALDQFTARERQE